MKNIKPDDKKESRLAWAIFLTALILRIAYWIFLKKNYFFYNNPSADVAYYQEWAKEIVGGNWLGDKTFFGLPLYPYFLAILYTFTLGNMFLVRLIHLLIGSANCVLVYLTGKRLFPANKNIAAISAFLCAANFILIYYDWLLMPATLLITLSLAIIYFLADYEKIEFTKDWFYLGILIGLAVLGDGKFLIFLGFIFVFFIWNKMFLKPENLKNFSILFLGAVLVIGLTAVRNRLVGGSWVLISAQNGLSFYVGNNEKATGTYANPDFIRPTHKGQDEDQKIMAEAATGRKLNDKEASDFWFNEGIKSIKNNPVNYARILLRKAWLFFGDSENSFDLDLIFQRKWKNILDFNPFTLICPLAILGLFFVGIKERRLAGLNLLIASQFIFTVMFFLNNRHRVTILPFLIIYEAAVLGWLICRFKEKHYAKIFLAMGFVILFAFVFHPETLASKEVEYLNYAKSAPILQKQNKLKAAKKNFLKALAIHPNDTNSLFNLANNYFLEENFAEAQKLYKKVLALNPRQVDAIYNLAFSYEKQNSIEEALKLYQKLTVMNDAAIDAHFRMAEIFKGKGDCAQANYHYQKVAQYSPVLKKEIIKLLVSCP